MRALHAFLTAVTPLLMLSACSGMKNDTAPPPNGGSVGLAPPPSGVGTFILSVRLLMPNGDTVDVPAVPESTDAVFTSVPVLDSILIPYYENKGDTATADSLRRSRNRIGNPHAYARHRLTSRSSVEAIE